MSKAADIGKMSAKGSFHFLWGLVISTVISSVGTIFIARLLGSDQFGLYTIVLTVPLLISIFRDWGVNFAMVRFTAQYRAQNRTREIRSIFLSGIIFETTLGIVLSLFSFLFAGFLATSVFNRPEIAPLIQIASFTVLASGLLAAATAVFTGYEKLELNSVMLICQSSFKTLLIIALVVLGLGTSGATIGFTAATFIAGIIGLALIFTVYRRLPMPIAHRLKIKAHLIDMLTYCLPLSFANIIAGLLPQFYAFLLPIHYATDNVMIGNYGIAMNFVVLIIFFATPITTTMFPAFSKIDPDKDNEALRNVFQFSIKYSSFLVIPVTALVMCLSQPAVETLFGTAYAAAPLFLSLLAIQYLYTAFGYLSIGGLLIGQGKTNYTLKMMILTGLIGFPMGYISILAFGVLGLIATTLIAGIPYLFISLRFIKKSYGATVDWHSSAKILLSSAIAASITFVAVFLLNFPSWVELILGIIIFIITLIPSALFTKSITQNDIQNLRGMTSGLGGVGNLLSKLLNILERIIVLLKL